MDLKIGIWRALRRSKHPDLSITDVCLVIETGKKGPGWFRLCRSRTGRVNPIASFGGRIVASSDSGDGCQKYSNPSSFITRDAAGYFCPDNA